MAFNNLDELYKYIKQEVALSMETDVAEKVKEIEIDNIKKDVFDVYSPKMYVRRTENGLDDPSNMKEHVEMVDSNVLLTVSNETTGFYEKDRYIADLIEYGDANYFTDKGQGSYTYVTEGSSYLNPRPFNEDTVNQLQTTNEHIIELQASLNRKFKVK